MANPKIDILYNTVVEEVLGTENPNSVNAIRICATRQGNAATTLAVEGLFIAIGHLPATALFKGQLDMDESGYITHRAGFRRAPACRAYSRPAM